MDILFSGIFSTVVSHPYVTFLIGMFFLGDVVFIPSIYLSAHGTLNVWAILGLALLAGMASDGFWYALGRVLPTEKINSWGFVKRRSRIQKRVSGLVNTHGTLMIVISKFTYGTRTLMQLIAGAQRITFSTYFKANFLGHLLWFGSTTLIAHFVQISVGGLRDTVTGTSVAFAVFVIIIILTQCILSRFLKQKYHLENGTETK